jgi:hypothetical protein
MRDASPHAPSDMTRDPTPTSLTVARSRTGHHRSMTDTPSLPIAASRRGPRERVQPISTAVKRQLRVRCKPSRETGDRARTITRGGLSLRIQGRLASLAAARLRAAASGRPRRRLRVRRTALKIRSASSTEPTGVVSHAARVQRRSMFHGRHKPLARLRELTDRLLRFSEHYRRIARPFDWTFTRADLERVLAKITEREPRLALAP